MERGADLEGMDIWIVANHLMLKRRVTVRAFVNRPAATSTDRIDLVCPISVYLSLISKLCKHSSS
jgi:hypothetical protein